MASEGMVQELERLRLMLDAHPSEQQLGFSDEHMNADSAYAGALSAAEVLVRYAKRVKAA